MIPTIEPPGAANQPETSPDLARMQEFVIACLRHRLGLGSLPDLSILTATPGFNPQSFITYAQEQRVAPLLHLALGGNDRLPLEVAQNFEHTYRITAQANLYLLHEFHQVLQALGDEGISVVVGKGVLLIEQIYHNPALRTFSDLDLFIQRQEVPAALTCLQKIGFEIAIQPYPGQALDFEKELMLTKSGIAPVVIDLHWLLFGPTYYHVYRVPQDWLWDRTVPAMVTGVAVESWPPEIQILHLSSHLVLSHANSPVLLWWYDLAALIQNNLAALQWDLILAYARQLHILLPVRQSLHTLKQEWGIPIPVQILDQLLAIQPSTEEVRAYRWRTLPDHADPHRAWEAFRALKNNRQRLRYIRMRLFPSHHYIHRILPVSESPFLLYLAYWYRGLRRVVNAFRVALMKKRR